MGRIIAVTSSLGGAGKTILRRTLTARSSQKSYNIAIIDAEPKCLFLRGADEIYDGPKKNVTTKASNENTRQDAQSLSTLNNVIFIDTADLERQTAAMAMRASELILIQLMACGDSLHEAFKVANQAQTLCIIARRTIPKRVVKSRWRPQNHAERATVQNLEAAELHGRNQHLSDLTEYSKISFRRAVPVSRRVGNEVANIIAELVALGASPTQGAEVAAAA